MPMMGCTEWTKLIDQYTAAQREYSRAVTAAGGLEGAAFERARANAERQKMAARAIELLMEEHQTKHGCTGRAESVAAGQRH